jgi:hypothetical protein
MQAQKQSIIAHLMGEQPVVEDYSAIADTFAGRIHIGPRPNSDTGGEFRRLAIVILIRTLAFACNHNSRPGSSRVLSVFVLISPIRV